jgi:hypothetical protein
MTLWRHVLHNDKLRFLERDRLNPRLIVYKIFSGQSFISFRERLAMLKQRTSLSIFILDVCRLTRSGNNEIDLYAYIRELLTDVFDYPYGPSNLDRRAYRF